MQSESGTRSGNGTKVRPEESPSGFNRSILGRSVSVIALSWSLFQLSLAQFIILESVAVRAIHLGFALLICFLVYPGLKTKAWDSRSSELSPTSQAVRVILGLMASLAAVYIVLDYDGISMRQGIPSTRDVVVGLLLIALLLEASRRVVGPALPIISIVFLLYALYGNHLPDFLAFKGVSLNRLLGQMTMSTEGVYGIPLDVSANIVFLFVLFGAMLEQGGAGNYFIRLALSLLGQFRGGPAKAAVLGSAMTGMVSGSSIANVVTTGTFTIPLMKRVGYPAKKAAAIEVAAGIDGQLMPPVMGAAAFIMAEYLNLSYLQVVKAAILPALISYAALLYITHVEACKLGIEGMKRDELPRFGAVFFSGIHYLIPIAVLLTELIYFRHSPQLSVFLAIVVLIVIIMVQAPVETLRRGGTVWQGLRNAIRIILDSLVAGGRNMVSVAIATACAGIIVGVVTLGLGGLVTEVIDHLSGGNLSVMLFITMLACLLIGMGLPTTATYIVMASLTAPAMVMLAGEQGLALPLIAAHLFCFYFGILADDTPPVGLASYAASAIAGSEPIATGLQGFAYHIRTAILPFMFVFNHDLLLIGVVSVSQGLLVLTCAIVGALAFVSATQGWLVTACRWYEVPALLAVTLIMMRPALPAAWLGLPHKYYAYVIGAAVYGAVYALQRSRVASNKTA